MVQGTLLRVMCECGAVHAETHTRTPYPFVYCFCSICRKTQGGSGCAAFVYAQADTLVVDRGAEQKKVLHARLPANRQSKAERHYCGECGTHLWVFDPDSPELLQVYASASSSRLPKPPEIVRQMLRSKPDWVVLPSEPDVKMVDYQERPTALDVVEWHKKHGLYITD